MDLEILAKLKESKEYRRLGKLFYTSQSAYLYDTGTGKVIELDQDARKLMEAFFDDNNCAEDFLATAGSISTIESICSFIEGEQLLSNPQVDEFVEINHRLAEANLECGQLIIELTGNCNLRCKYCIYNDFYEGNRSFNTSNIDFDTAKKAIDYVYAHRDPDHLAITFYGGEPLLNFNVMRQCIDYCLEKFGREKLSFSLTTNLTLMTKEIAEYLAQIPNMSITVSIDGPEEIHNMSRVKGRGQGSFRDAFSGLLNLSEAVNKYKRTMLMVSVVLMPPYTAERFNAINDFFESLDFLPENTEVRATYPRPGTISQSYIDDLHMKGLEAVEEINWMDWSRQKINLGNLLGEKKNLYASVLEYALARIHNRILYEKPLPNFYRNGCCIPGHRRLYVSTDGSYRVCERIGTAPVIGHVDTGLDAEAVIKSYIEAYDAESLPNCSQCWAINLCDICYASCYDEHGINMKEKMVRCEYTRSKFATWLQYYHELLETKPEIIQNISQIELA